MRLFKQSVAVVAVMQIDEFRRLTDSRTSRVQGSHHGSR
jgi:hypothetical protein